MLLLTRRPTESLIITTPDGTEIVVSGRSWASSRTK